MSRVVLFSGGMDSLLAWQLYAPEAALCYVRIGAPYEARELESLRRRGLLVRVRVSQVSERLGARADAAGRVQLRNLLFAVAAAAETGADEIVLGALAGETSPDKSRRFAALASSAMSESEHRTIRLVMPFRGVTKAQLVCRFLRDTRLLPGEAERVLRACPSCYAESLPDGVAGCGTCTSCLRRWVAMSLNGISERYLVDPGDGDWLHAGRGRWWNYLRRTPVRDWPGVVRVNLELLRALRCVERRRMGLSA